MTRSGSRRAAFVRAGWYGPAVTMAAAGVLVAVSIGSPPAAAATPTQAPKLAAEHEVSVPPGPTGARPASVASPTARAALRGPLAAPVWPAAGVATVTMAAAKRADATTDTSVAAGAMPIALSAPAALNARATATMATTVRTQLPATVRVQLLPHDKAVAAGRVLDLAVARGDGSTAAGRVNLSVDYSTFAHAYGGDWANRLRLQELPACAATTPDAAACQPIAVPYVNDPQTQTVTATVALAATTTANARTLGATTDLVGSATAGGVTMMTLTSGSSSGAGDFTASPLKASSTWAAGNQSGSFTWSYPFAVPPAQGGPEPDLSLDYDSQSVDGEMAASNNQPGEIGEGFSFNTGVITRSYKGCADDITTTGTNKSSNQTKTGDLCWGSYNATLSLGGHSGELIKDDTNGSYHLKGDDGTKIQLLNDSTNANGDNDNEYWLVTTTDGTKYYFGMNHIPGWVSGKPATNSVSTVPVNGNNPTEPCYNATFTSGFCNQAWQWQLDYVVDTYGNSMSMWYTQETNNYGRNNSTSSVSNYDRGAYLKEIDYGTDTHTAGKDSFFTSSAPDKVLIGMADRCVTSGSTCVPTTPSNWPDVPWDQSCTSTTSCTQHSPTFFTQKRVNTITTEFWDASLATPAYDAVDVWTLHQTYPDPGDSTRAGLWLASISHQGKVGGTATVPDVVFSGIQLKNRVGIAGDQEPPMNWWRLANVTTEIGEHLSVVYDTTNSHMCAQGATPTPSSNTTLCYPVFWTRPLGTTPTIDWFNKYVVKSVTDNDSTGGAPAVAESYGYGTPAWHFDEDNGLVPASRKTWAQWRGFNTVTTTGGDSADVQTQSKSLYFQGMNGDKAATGTKTVNVTDSTGTAVPDDEPFAGMVREQITYNGPGGTEVSGQINDMFKSSPTATRTVAGYTVSAYHTGVAKVRSRTDLDGGRGLRQTETDNTFNTNGDIIQSWDKGNTSVAGDDTCETKTLLSNSGANIIDVVQRDTVVALPCGTSPTSDQNIISDTEYSYDGQAYAAAPTKGDVTKTQTAKAWTPTAQTFLTTNTATFDTYGRTATSTDVRGNTTTTTYTPATGGPVTAESTVMTTADPTITGWTTSETIQPAWGAITESVDINNHKTNVTYDALGRTTAVWKPNRSKATGQSANSTYAYTVSNTAGRPSVVATSTLDPAANYVTSYSLVDGLGRTRQTQSPAVGGGKIVTDTFYNTTGQTAEVSGPYFNGDSGPSTTLFPVPLDVNVPSQTQTVYDGTGRPTVSKFVSAGLLQWQTTTTYGGDHTDTTAPSGGAVAAPVGGAASTIVDAQDRTTETRQYPGLTPTGTVYDKTTSTYNEKGQLTQTADSAATSPNVWTYSYDLLGRKIASTDPDQRTSTGAAGGKTSNSYNDFGDLLSTTDPMGQTLTYTYDVLGRQKTETEATPTEPATQIASWTYDTASGGKNQVASATRTVAGNQYTQTILGYSLLGQLGAWRWSIPTSEGSLGGSYAFSIGYNIDGSISNQTEPAMGDLFQETIAYNYDPTSGLPTTMTTNYGGTSKNLVTSTVYTSFGEPNITTMQDSTTEPWVQQGLSYDPATRQLAESKTQKATAPVVLGDTRYSYNAAGEITKQSDAPQGGTSDNQCFSYDALQRLTAAWTPSNGDCTVAPAASALGGAAPYWQSWTYDTSNTTDPTSILGSTGNRRTETNHAVAGNTTMTLSYPAAASAQPHAPTASTTTGPAGTTHGSYVYNADGQTTSRPGPNGQQALAYNPEGNLASLTDTSGSYTYTYDASGNRLLAHNPSDTTLYLGDTELNLDGGGVKTATRYYTYNGQTIAQRTGSGLQFCTGDPHGTSTIAVADTAAQAVTKRYQTPFGDPRGAGVTWTGTKSFVGGDQDPTGLIHEGAREYDALLGRFASLDPIFDAGDPQSWNGYAYADNNPILKMDPTGTIGQCISIDGSGVCGSQLKHKTARDNLNDYENRQHKTSPNETIRSTAHCATMACYNGCKYGGCGTDSRTVNKDAFAPTHKEKTKPRGMLSHFVSSVGHGLNSTGHWLSHPKNLAVVFSVVSLAVSFCPLLACAATAGLLGYASAGLYLLGNDPRAAELQAAATTFGLIPGVAELAAADRGEGLVTSTVATISTHEVAPLSEVARAESRVIEHIAPSARFAANFERTQKVAHGAQTGITAYGIGVALCGGVNPFAACG
jgi:RHS repeat-associated protein